MKKPAQRSCSGLLHVLSTRQGTWAAPRQLFPPSLLGTTTHANRLGFLIPKGPGYPAMVLFTYRLRGPFLGFPR
jgi:hypothetical protein